MSKKTYVRFQCTNFLEKYTHRCHFLIQANPTQPNQRIKFKQRSKLKYDEGL